MSLKNVMCKQNQWHEWYYVDINYKISFYNTNGCISIIRWHVGQFCSAVIISHQSVHATCIVWMNQLQMRMMSHSCPSPAINWVIYPTTPSPSSVKTPWITWIHGWGVGGQLLMLSPEMLKSKIPIFAGGEVGGWQPTFCSQLQNFKVKSWAIISISAGGGGGWEAGRDLECMEFGAAT